MARLLKAYLDLEQSHEYLRQKLNAKMKQECWSFDNLFETCDIDGKGYISVLDLQLILSHSKNKNFCMKELEYLLKRYDRAGNLTKKINFKEFVRQMEL